MKFIKIAIALLIVGGMAYWAYDSVRARSYAGSALEFVVGNGSRINLTHDGDAPLVLDMSSSGSFAVTSSETELNGSGTREGTGRAAVYRYQVELPAGVTDFRVTRGSNITFATEGATADAVVTPMDADAARSTVIVAIVVILGALFYISRTLQHRWLKAIMLKLSPGSQPAAPASASEAGR